MTQEWHYMTPLPRFESVTIAEGKKESREVSSLVYNESKSIDLDFVVSKNR